MAEKQSNSERYRELVAARKAADETYKVTGPSGFEFTLRRISVPAYIAIGKLPLSISAKIAEVVEGKSDTEAAFASLSMSEQFEALRFIQFLVREAVVNPKIVQEAKNEDEIDELLPEDFAFLVNEIAGGEEAERLGNFRNRKTGPVPVARARRKGIRKASK